jgi:hypothetical protein
MGIFYHVVEGDPLDSGNNSEVIEGLRDCTIEGPDGRYRNQAFIGHRAYCGACESAGPIAGGPGTPGYNLRMYDATIRAREAVEGDIVVCKCSPPPRIIAVYGRSSSIHDVDRSANSTASATDAMRVLGAAASGALAPALTKSYDEQIQLLTDSGTPVANTKYKIVSASRKALISIGRTLIDLVSPTLLKPSQQHRIWLVDMVWEA